MFRKYLMLNAEEIRDIVKCAADENKLDKEDEHDLHVLLENRKHIKQFMEEMGGRHEGGE